MLEVVHLALGDTNSHRHVSADCRANRFIHFKAQRETLANIATPAVITRVGVVGKELIEQVAISAMDLYAIESRNLCCITCASCTAICAFSYQC